MPDLAHDDIAWASKAMDDGRSLSYVASVLETSVSNAQKAIHRHRYGGPTPRERAETYFSKPEEIDFEPPKHEPKRRGRPPKIDLVDLEALRERRTALLRRRFARYWDQIWYLRSRRMSGRTLRGIYGAECLIWSVGGGIDPEI